LPLLRIICANTRNTLGEFGSAQCLYIYNPETKKMCGVVIILNRLSVVMLEIME